MFDASGHRRIGQFLAESKLKFSGRHFDDGWRHQERPGRAAHSRGQLSLLAGFKRRNHDFGTLLRQDLRGLAIATPSQGTHPVAPTVEQGLGDTSTLLT